MIVPTGEMCRTQNNRSELVFCLYKIFQNRNNWCEIDSPKRISYILKYHVLTCVWAERNQVTWCTALFVQWSSQALTDPTVSKGRNTLTKDKKQANKERETVCKTTHILYIRMASSVIQCTQYIWQEIESDNVLLCSLLHAALHLQASRKNILQWN